MVKKRTNSIYEDWEGSIILSVHTDLHKTRFKFICIIQGFDLSVKRKKLIVWVKFSNGRYNITIFVINSGFDITMLPLCWADYKAIMKQDRNKILFINNFTNRSTNKLTHNYVQQYCGVVNYLILYSLFA